MLNALGVGVDLVEVERARKMLADKGSHVYDRLLTAAEAAYCRSRPDPAEHVAVRLAAKEAVYKALQGSDAARGIGWRDIEVVRERDGRPQVTLHGLARERADELRAGAVMLSLSHTHEAAIAVAIVVGPGMPAGS
ncbi:MAG TPA: holo-ACP synthase [Gemmatimonadales bacterium]|nr:holo-ACP synthase [Gemmatimonadales bacterium]